MGDDDARHLPQMPWYRSRLPGEERRWMAAKIVRWCGPDVTLEMPHGDQVPTRVDPWWLARTIKAYAEIYGEFDSLGYLVVGESGALDWAPTDAFERSCELVARRRGEN